MWATATDEAVVKMLRRKGKPVFLVANKVDDFNQEAEAAVLWGLGFGQPWPVSALHGRGTADLLDAVMEKLPTHSAYGGVIPSGGPRRIALIGRPNVGKSSLLNKLAGSQRVVVDDYAGTTRDPVDELVELGGEVWRFVDTAGIRRRQHMAVGSDYYASLRTQSALEKAEVAVVLLAANETVSEQDVRIIQLAIEAGRALVVVFNKWDEVDEDRRYYLEQEIDRDLAHIHWAPRVNMSAKTGWHKDKMIPALHTALESWTSASRPASSTPSWASSSRPTRTRCAAASSHASCSAPRPRPARRSSCCSPPDSWIRATAASSPAACVRPLVSTAARSKYRCESANAAAATGNGSKSPPDLV